MEENVFEEAENKPGPSRGRTESLRSQTFPVTISHWYTHISTFTILCLVIIQTALGVMANSLCLIADAARQLADHLEQYKYDRTAIPAARVREIILTAIPIVGIMILCVIFLVNASNRAATLDFKINILFLIIGTVLAVFTNVLQIGNHVREWRYSRVLNRPWTERRGSRLFHVIINHSLPLVLVVVTVMVSITPNLRLADSIGTYITTFVVIANIASASRRCYQEYVGLDREDYQQLP